MSGRGSGGGSGSGEGAEWPDRDLFCYVSWFGGFYGWCGACGRVMFWNCRWRSLLELEEGGDGSRTRAVGRCEECGGTAELREGEVLLDRGGWRWVAYRRVG